VHGQAVADQEDLATGIAPRRARKRIRMLALIAPSSTIQRRSPLLLTAKISPSPARLWLTRIVGVRPRGASPRPRTSSERKPVSSAQKITPPAALACATIAG